MPRRDDAYYFGCWAKNNLGHFLYAPDGRGWYTREEELPRDFPVKPHVLDGALLGLDGLPQREGEATFGHLNGWTLLSFWDRSADRRGASSSSFVLRGEHTFEVAVAAARAAFPSVWARIDAAFEVRLRQHTCDVRDSRNAR